VRLEHLLSGEIPYLAQDSRSDDLFLCVLYESLFIKI